MSKFNASTFLVNVPIGANITLILSSGRVFEGNLSVVADDHIEVRKNGVSLGIYSYEMIMGFEFIDPMGRENESLPHFIPTPEPKIKTELERKKEQEQELKPKSIIDIKIAEGLAKIEIPFLIETKTAKLQELPLRFRVVEGRYSLPDQLQLNPYFDRLTNIWNNAYRYKEMSRLEQVVLEWKGLAEKHPGDPTFAYNLGCLHLSLERVEEAIRAFYQAGKDSDSYFNLVATALRTGKRQLACYALQQYFTDGSPMNRRDVWLLYVGLSVENNAASGLKTILNRNLEDNQDGLRTLIVETIIFLLKSCKKDETASSLMAELLIDYSGDLITLDQLYSSLNEVSDFPDVKQLPEVTEMLEDRKRDRLSKQSGELLKTARSLGAVKKFDIALEKVRRVLDHDPDNAGAKNLEADLRQKLEIWEKNKSANHQVAILLPSVRGPYREAKKADLEEKDLEKAERLYRQAIAQNDSWESAIKDLAHILNRQGRHRNHEAIELLQSNLNKAQNKRAFRNTLVTIYQADGQFTEAIRYLRELLHGANQVEKSRIQKQISLCYFKAGLYDEAEKSLQEFLKQWPDDLTAQQWLENLRVARKTGDTSDLDAWWSVFGQLADFANPLSYFLQFHVERSQYEGVKADIVAARSFSLKDVEILAQRAHDMGIGRPRERSNYFLSAAKILRQLSDSEDFAIRRHLRNFCAAMGDACLAENKHLDIARGYYSEAFSVAPEWADQLGIKLEQFVNSFYYTKPEDLLRTRNDLIKSFTQAFVSEELRNKIVEELLHLSIGNREIAAALVDRLYDAVKIREHVIEACQKLFGSTNRVTSKEDFTKLWDEGRKWVFKKQNEFIHELRIMVSTPPSFPLLQEHNQRLNLLKDKLRSDLDNQRIDKTGEILNFSYDYNRQNDYREQERLAALVASRCNELMQEIETGPTKITLELLYPYIRSLKSFIEDNFRQVQDAAEPEITVALAFDDYTPNDKSVIGCQIHLTNSQRKSPASSVTLKIEASPTDHYKIVTPTISIPEALAGGDSVTCEAPVQITEQAKKDLVFTLYCSLTYTTRSGQEITMDDHRLSLRLHSAAAFHEIGNPYLPYAAGLPVDNEKMFVGRVDFINDLVRELNSSTINTCLVIYGQKRTGKTSVLIHIQKQLKYPFIPVRLTIGDVIEDLQHGGLAAFLYFLARGINREIERLPNLASAPCPGFSEFRERPQGCFDEYLNNQLEKFSSSDSSQNARLVLMLDEFSYLYNQIVKRNLPDTLMKAWKALLEKKYFSCIISGQDYMPKFMNMFPNEFQVANRNRVSYLSPSHARELIEQPILILPSGESRFRGAAGEAAIQRIIDLTAGNPYYLQAFCSRLVQLMSDQKKAVYATDAYVDEVKRQMIRGEKSLSRDYFDSLVSSGDETIEAFSEDQVWKVLREVAYGSRNLQACARSSINLSTDFPIDEILHDLVERDVLERIPPSSFKIKVGLFKEWLLEHE